MNACFAKVTTDNNERVGRIAHGSVGAKEIRDVIFFQSDEKYRLIAIRFDVDSFQMCIATFPVARLNNVVNSHPMLNKNKL